MNLNEQQLRTQIAETETEILKVVRGNPRAVRLLLASIFAEGHVLIEDVPGVGKTTLARCVSKVIGCEFSRIQFTSDMLPSDVIGATIMDGKSGQLYFRKGPIFSQMILADEINRASPKTQSALLEVMADRQISVENETYILPRPFSVIATQNPIEQYGAYPLPESQLDRFMVRFTLGYPPKDDEKALLMEPSGSHLAFSQSKVILNPEKVIQIQEMSKKVILSENVANYILELAHQSRNRREILLGMSPRGSLALAHMARAWALLDGRDFILPDDVKTLLPYVMAHRLVVAQGGIKEAEERVLEIIEDVKIPR